MPSQQLAVLFDLDGTLTDSKPGIVACLHQVLEAHNLFDYGDLGRFVGPPVDLWTHELLPEAPEEVRTELTREYRSLYNDQGWKNNSVYLGVREMLANLQAKGVPLFVCTSKIEHSAIRVLELFDLTKFFVAVYGDKPEYTEHGKAALLHRLLREQNLDAATSWMVGDRIFDIEAARANGLRSLAASWGYGDAAEHAQADAIAAIPADVVLLLLPTR